MYRLARVPDRMALYQLAKFSQEHSRPPKLEELAARLGKSPASAHLYLQRLLAESLVEQGARNASSSYTLSEEGLRYLRREHPGVFDESQVRDGHAELPLLPYRVNANSFPSVPEIFSDANDGRTIRLPEELLDLRGEGKLAAVTVDGVSMLDALIAPGDIVVLQQVPPAENGSLIVAQVAERQYVIKRLYREAPGKPIELQSVNDDARFPPIIIDNSNATDFQIVGRVACVIRAQPSARPTARYTGRHD